MNHIKQFEELDFFKRLIKSAKPEPIGREPMYGPDKKEPNKPQESSIVTEVVKWLTDNKDKLHVTNVETSSKGPNNIQWKIDVTIAKSFYLQSIKSEKFKSNLKDCHLIFDLMDSTFKIVINLERDLKQIVNLGNTRRANLDYQSGIREFNIGYSKIETSETYYSKAQDIKLIIEDKLKYIGTTINHISETILKIELREIGRVERERKEKEEADRKEKIRRENEVKELKRLEEFHTHIDEVSDCLVELEDLAGGSKYFSKQVANYYMWFEYKIDGFLKHENSIIINDTSVDVLKAVANAKKQIVDIIPKCEVNVDFSNKHVKVWVVIQPEFKIRTDTGIVPRQYLHHAPR
jgi:hypothetical protein